MADEGQKKLKFIKQNLPQLILDRNKDLKNQTIVKCSAEASVVLDGFMSAIYTVELVLKDGDGKNNLHQIIVKTMKEDKTMQCPNEIYIYKEVLPYLQKFVTESGASMTTPDWCPRVYFADFKHFPAMSDEEEIILALENLKPLGYRLGPRIDLDETHLRMTIKQIATYNAVNYAMRIMKDPMLEKLAKGIMPFSYLEKDGQEMEPLKTLYVIALKRFFKVIESDPKFKKDKNFFETIQKFKKIYFKRPLVLMQKFLETDEIFSIILFGDFNRNNVLFQYEKSEGFENPKTVKIFDFQHPRYATPALNLAFFMYMNISPELRSKVWDSLLKLYHETLTLSLLDILKCDKTDERLKPYSFENFIKHFKNFAFYGVMVGIHFIPWMACPEDECQKLVGLFATDIQNPEFKRLCQICGGKDVDYRITSIAQHAFEKGYMDIFE